MSYLILALVVLQVEFNIKLIGSTDVTLNISFNKLRDVIYNIKYTSLTDTKMNYLTLMQKND